VVGDNDCAPSSMVAVLHGHPLGFRKQLMSCAPHNPGCQGSSPCFVIRRESLCRYYWQHVVCHQNGVKLALYSMKQRGAQPPSRHERRRRPESRDGGFLQGVWAGGKARVGVKSEVTGGSGCVTLPLTPALSPSEGERGMKFLDAQPRVALADSLTRGYFLKPLRGS